MSLEAATDRSNVERFLGPEAAERGPFGLLGLPVEQATDEAVIEALERRLGQVNAHRHAETPQADEVRLALHAAAAQLLDENVRRHMLRRWGGDGAAETAPPATDEPPRPRPRSAQGSLPRELLLLEHDAILTLAMHGGWNRESLHRIAMLARARGVPASRVGDAVRAIAQRRARPRTLAPTPTERPRPAPPAATAAPRPAAPAPVAAPAAEPDAAAEAEDSPEGRTLWTLLGGVLGVMIVAISLLGLLTVMQPMDTSPAQRPQDEPQQPIAAADEPDEPAEQAEQPGAEDEPEEADPGPAPLALETPEQIRSALADATSAIELDPRVATDDFEEIVQRLALAWPQLSREQRLSTNAALVDFLYRLGASPEQGVRAIGAIASGVAPLTEERIATPDEVFRAAWSAGMLTRLGREQDLSAAVTSRIDAGLISAFGGVRDSEGATFEAGAASALGLMPGILLAQPPADAPEHAWRAWAEAASAIATGADERHALLIAGLERLLRRGPEPVEAEWTFDAAAAILSRMDFDEHRPRRWLLSALARDDYSAADLRVVTRTIAHERLSESIDMGMTLSSTANDRERRDLRERYAAAWGITDSLEDDAARAAWLEALEDARRQLAGDVTAREHLATTARLAIINQAAARLWNAEPDAALSVLEDIEPRLERATTSAAGRRASMPPSSDGDWAVQYISVRRNMQARIALLDSLAERGRRLTVMDAEVLAEEALRADRQPVRERARDTLRRFLDQPAVINGLLEQLPHMPTTRRNFELIADAGAVQPIRADDPDWELAARRALVERLLELLAGEGDFAIVDELASVLAESYAARAASQASPADAPPADQAAGVLQARWRRRAESMLANPSPPLRLDSMRTSRASRLGIAEGPVQRFAAEQLAIAELMAYVAIAERPELKDRVATLLDELAQQRRRAEHLFEQLAAVELAMAELWRLRMGD